jgi:hypothetical protein
MLKVNQCWKGELVAADKNATPVEETVSLVSQQDELITTGVEDHGRATNNLAPVSKAGIIWEDKLT